MKQKSFNCSKITSLVVEGKLDLELAQKYCCQVQGDNFPGQTRDFFFEIVASLPRKKKLSRALSRFWLLASLCMLATIVTGTPTLCFGFAPAALVFFFKESEGKKLTIWP